MSVRIALGARPAAATERIVPRLIESRVASRVFAQDSTLWASIGTEAQAPPLSWTEALPEAHDLAEQHSGRSRAGGTVWLADAGDGAAAIAMLVATAGGTIGIAERGTTFSPEDVVVVNTAGGEAVEAAAGAGSSVVRIDTTATTALDLFSPAVLAPAGRSGVDLRELIDEAEAEASNLAVDAPVNNGLILGAVLTGEAVTVVADGTHILGFDRWAADVLAVTTGGAAAAAPVLTVRLVHDAHAGKPGDDEVLLSGALGELALVWLASAVVASVPDPQRVR